MNRTSLEKELKSIGTDEIQNLMTENILEVYDVIQKQGHSGFSFGYFKNLLERLVLEDGLINPIKSIAEDPDDWASDIYGPTSGGKVYQNKRKPSVFCTVKDGKEIYKDQSKAIFTDNGGENWFSSKKFDQFTTIKVPYLPDNKKWYIYTEPTVELNPGESANEDEYVITKIEYK